MEKNKKKENNNRIFYCKEHHDILVSVNSNKGQQKEYIFPETESSDVIVLNSAASTAADMGVQVLQPWKNKMKEEIDYIKNDSSYEFEVELNFGIVKFRLKRKPKNR